MEIFDYDNILLLPRKCRVQSRAECDPSVEFGGRRFKLPVVPANMRTVLDEAIAVQLARGDHFYVMHRFDLDSVAFAQRMRKAGLFVSISAGVKDSDRETMKNLDSSAVSYRIVLTKADQLEPADIPRAIAAAETVVRKHGAAHPGVMATSSETGHGIPELRAEIVAAAQG